MRFTLSTLALAALAVAKPMPQGITSDIAPKEEAPAGCSGSYSGKFEIQVVNVTKSKRDIEKRAALILTLEDGILMDAKDRTGYIAANNQFQFDGPPQTGAIYTAGWSVCKNNSLALGDSTIFYQCLSGTFYNLYDEATAEQCSPVYIQALASGSDDTATVISDGQVTASPVPASQISDGQIQATTAPVTQISDGQIQATTAPVTQISDGQIQATPAVTGKPVTQISDGQIQATTNGTFTSATPTMSASAGPATYVGAAAMPSLARGELFGLAAGVFAVAML